MILFFRGRGYLNLSSPEVHWDQLNVSRYSLRACSLGCPGGGAGKEGELATTSLEFEYLHRKSRCEMLLGGDDIRNDVITLMTRSFTCFFNVFFFYYLSSFPLRADRWKSDSSVDEEPQENMGAEFKF